jgi:hypothetical protein
VTEDAKPFTKCIVPTVAFIISNVTICSSLDLHLRADPLDRSLWRRIFALVLERESSKLLVGVEYRVDSQALNYLAPEIACESWNVVRPIMRSRVVRMLPAGRRRTSSQTDQIGPIHMATRRETWSARDQSIEIRTK